MGLIQQSGSFSALSLKHLLSVIPGHWNIRQIDSSFYGVSVQIELLIDGYASGFFFTIWLKSLSSSEFDHINKESYHDNLAIRLLNIPTRWLNNLYESTEINFIAIDIPTQCPESSTNNIHFVLVDSYINNRLNLLLPNWRELETVSIEFPDSNTLNLAQGINKMEVLAKYKVIEDSGIKNSQQYITFSSLLVLYLQRCKTQNIETILNLIDTLSMIQDHHIDSNSIDRIMEQIMPEIELNKHDSQNFQQQIQLFNQLAEYDKQKHNDLYNAISHPPFVPY